MAIRVNTNIASLNAQRNLDSSQMLLSKTLERLSSGLRINRAADDAAGLAVSEKLRTQVRGFTQAIGNSQDAINLIATAESGLDQTSQILQRMRELSIQAASDTLVNSDRGKIQEEITQLRSELTRIAETTQFNTRNLLDGSIAQTANKNAATAEIKQGFRIGDVNATVPALRDFFTTNTEFQAVYGTTFSSQDKDRVTLWTAPAGNVVPVTIDVAFQFKVVSYQNGSTAPVSVAIEVSNSISGFLYSVDVNDAASFTDQGGQEGLTYNQIFGINKAPLQLSLIPPSASRPSGDSIGQITIPPGGLTLSDIGKVGIVQITAPRNAVTTDSALTFQVGANEGQFLKMGVGDMRASALRLETINILGTNDEASRLKAQNAIGVIDNALEYVNTHRSRLGAFQNRVEYTIANLQVSRENLSASESRIRDTDVAAETANLTRAQILTQAGTSVLTQANISPQSALSLLGR